MKAICATTLVVVSMAFASAIVSAQSAPPPNPTQQRGTVLVVPSPPAPLRPTPSTTQIQVTPNPVSNGIPGSNGGRVDVTVPLPGGDPPKK